jgi:hypothetical protein
MIAVPRRNSRCVARSASWRSIRSLRKPPRIKAAIPGSEPKMFHAALICPDMTCCWPMAEVNPFCALETNRKDVPSSREATRSD